MLIIGELINSSRKIIKEKLTERDSHYICSLAKRQAKAGADYIDVNCSDLLNEELGTMKWLIDTIQAEVALPLSIDTPNPKAMELGLSLAHNGKPMLNSITAEEKRYKAMLPLALKYEAAVLALCMDEQGVPANVDDRLKVGRRLVRELTESGIASADIYLDMLAQPIAINDRAGIDVLDAIRIFKQEFPEINIICGLSNISYGLPNRRILNRVFMIQAMAMGVDAFILDPLDRVLMGYVHASRALLGQDKFCKDYLSAHRKGIYHEYLDARKPGL